MDEQRDAVEGITTALRADVPELDDPRTALARRAMRFSAILEDQITRCLTPLGLTKADYAVLLTLLAAGEPYCLRPTDLRAQVLITSGGVSGVLNRLERSGLIDRRPDASDGRGSMVRLTDAGVAAAAAAVRSWTRAQQDLLRNLSDAAAEAAADSLRDVLITLDDRDRRRSAL